MFETKIKELQKEIIQKTQDLIRIPSVNTFSTNPNKPFGEAANDALIYMLTLGKELGFRTKNLDGYCGYIEFGEGEEILGIIGHLDVVPEGEDWTYPPFSATISDDNIFGRGAIDDKGPVIASLYAMKIVMDQCQLNKRVRLILGLNEEKDWKCINYYKKHEELPTIGFSPDADFPCIYAEKSIMTCYISMDYSTQANQSIVIKTIDCNNNPLNVVPKICSIILKINPNSLLMCDLISYAKDFIQQSNLEIDLYKIDEEEIKLTSHGIQAHAAHPDLGENAISQLLVLLQQIFNHYKISLSFLDFFTHYIGMQYDGKYLGINESDESGNLTLNVGTLKLENNNLKFDMNLRVPVMSDCQEIENKFKTILSSYSDLTFETTHYMPSLYLSKDNYLVRTLCNIYNETTHSNLEPIAIGGATYARAFENCISFGANLPGHKDMCHQTDEFISIDNLLLACEIYARAIYELGTK